jgi:hypothetical protein
MPGIYRFTNLLNGMMYIGRSKNIRTRVMGYAHDKPERDIIRAFYEFGHGRFLIEPIYYSTNGYDELALVETALIITHDTLRSGYNATDVDFCYPPEIEERRRQSLRDYAKSDLGQRANSERMLASWQTASHREKRAASFADPEVHARRSAAISKAMRRPEVVAKCQTESSRAKRSVVMTEIWTDPQLRAAKSAEQKAYLSDPEIRAARLEQIAGITQLGCDAAREKVLGSIWITDGTTNKRVPKGNILMEGWRVGRSQAYGFAEPGKSIKPGAMYWITDGTNDSKILKDAPIPEGWRPGCTKAGRYERKALICITDGTDSKKIPANAVIPDGWWLGRNLEPRSWITNGVDNKLLAKDVSVPSGWRPGRIV